VLTALVPENVMKWHAFTSNTVKRADRTEISPNSKESVA
jgi:hypothetical protein